MTKHKIFKRGNQSVYAEPIGKALRKVLKREPTTWEIAATEANMRVHYGTLDHLDSAVFLKEAKLAVECMKNAPKLMNDLMATYGLKG